MLGLTGAEPRGVASLGSKPRAMPRHDMDYLRHLSDQPSQGPQEVPGSIKKYQEQPKICNTMMFKVEILVIRIPSQPSCLLLGDRQCLHP